MDDSGFDIHRPWQPEEAAARWEAMRDSPGLCRFAEHGGFYVAARFDDVLEVLLNPETFSSARGITLPPPRGVRSNHIPAEVDPPLHQEYRAIVQPLFSAQRAREAEPRIREIARNLIAAIPHDEPVDFVRAFARPLPIRVALDLVGAPQELSDELEQMVEDLHHEVATGESRGGGKRLEAFAYDLLKRAAIQGGDAGSNVVSAILGGRISGRALAPEEQMSMVRLILVGGFDTTSIALANLAVWLAGNPAEAQQMTGDAGRIDLLSEEIVRRSSPSTYLRREVTRSAVLAGTQLEPGDSVLVAYGSANLDPRKFERPGCLLPDRRPNPHVGFGAGRHRCIGSFVAKAQMRAAFEEMVAAFSSIEIDRERPITYHSGLGQGYKTLPVRMHPRAA